MTGRIGHVVCTTSEVLLQRPVFGISMQDLAGDADDRFQMRDFHSVAATERVALEDVGRPGFRVGCARCRPRCGC